MDTCLLDTSHPVESLSQGSLINDSFYLVIDLLLVVVLIIDIVYKLHMETDIDKRGDQ